MTKRYIAASLKKAVRERARGFCEYCRSQQRFSTLQFSFLHLLRYILHAPALGVAVRRQQKEQLARQRLLVIIHQRAMKQQANRLGLARFCSEQFPQLLAAQTAVRAATSSRGSTRT